MNSVKAGMNLNQNLKKMDIEKIKITRGKVAKILTKARQQKGLSQTDLGEKVGFAQNTIARIENCRFSPNADQLYAICEALDITITLDGNPV
jgi:ribosome-binding protein aMBF1 (putative translation factor)